MQSYIHYAHARGLQLSNSRAVCVHAVLGTRCPDFGTVCTTDAPRPFIRIVDHPVLYRLGNDRVLIVEPYADVETAAESARIMSEVLSLKYAVGTPGSGPWATASGVADTSLVPVAFAQTQQLADYAVSEAAR